MHNPTATTYLNNKFLVKEKNQQLFKRKQIKISYIKLEQILGVKKAKFVSKVNYWLNKSGKEINILPGTWIYNPIHAWAKQLNCSESTVKRTIKSLEENDILFSKKVNAKRYNQTKWYNLNYKKINILLKDKSLTTEVVQKKWTNQLDQNDPIILKNNKTNYTKTSSNENVTKKTHITLQNYKIALSQNEKILVSQMITLWNQVFKYSRNPIIAYHSQSNGHQLLNVLKIHFQSSTLLWCNYAKMVNTSKFLMGEKKTKKNFKAVFSWLLQDDTVIAIQSKEYGVGDRIPDTYRNNNKNNNSKYYKEFNTYIQKEQWIHDEDQYKIKRYFGPYLTSQHLLNDSKYRANYAMILKKYIFQKEILKSSY